MAGTPPGPPPESSTPAKSPMGAKRAGRGIKRNLMSPVTVMIPDIPSYIIPKLLRGVSGVVP